MTPPPATPNLLPPMPVQQAVILCGGKGTRLADRVRDLPKPMIPIDGRPVLDHIIANLAKAGIRWFLLAAGYLGDVIARHYATPRQVGCQIDVVNEPEPGDSRRVARVCRPAR